jgi:hypothetical protein
MKKIFCLLISFVFVSTSSIWALDVDEKLTLRLLKTSQTRKTILINRGTEDGLVEGDHAKFFTPTGIIARAVLVKISPSRSVWSVYRLVNADFLVTDAVMSLKITPPVKVTQDESRMVVLDDTPTEVVTEDPESLGIPLAEGAKDMTPLEQKLAQYKEMASLEKMAPTSIRELNKEIYLFVNFSSLSSSTKNTNNSTSFKASSAHTQTAIGGELYAKQDREWWTRFSLFLHLLSERKSLLNFDGSRGEDSRLEFYGGTHFHPWTRPAMVGEFIPYISFGVGMGTATSEIETNLGASDSAKGSTFATSFGFGLKFYTAKGWGARIEGDYLSRQESLKQSSGSQPTWERASSGPRLLVGLSLRF